MIILKPNSEGGCGGRERKIGIGGIPADDGKLWQSWRLENGKVSRDVRSRVRFGDIKSAL